VEQTPNIGAMDADAAPRKFNAQLIECQIAVLLYALAHKLGVPGKLAPTLAMALPTRFKRTRRGLQQDQIVNATTRLRSSIGCGLPIAVLLQTEMNHQSRKRGIPNHVSRNTL